ncbi:hypothetical protein NX801_15785 [Streptomyces sp. LP05-1]|uniref:MmpS family membrane protein n=1 Tax=Streptomyces pyxinae TaxID=2970734 RepID=A0ABT2CI49_9ACTN|nr:hypothetical protein [Streptomyces sp. LP05-1]MCS0637094.1 hypothetical protein [Streptomyces sp. LP05-1]
MNRISRAMVSICAAGGLALGLGACSQVADEATKQVDKAVDEAVDTEYEVTYEVGGTKVDSIQYNAGGGTAADPEMETVENPALPWKKTVKLRGIEAPLVLPVALDATGSGKVTCKIVHQGKALVEKSGEGVLSAGGCVAVSPAVG